MDEELESFIRDRKARVAADKASLQQDPPYMEIRDKPQRVCGSTVKENVPPNSTAHGKADDGRIGGLPLGVEYEKKKQRLQHELRMDYRRYMSQRDHFDPGDPGGFIYDNRRPNKLPPDDWAGGFPRQTRGLAEGGGPSSDFLRPRDRRGRLLEQEEEEEEVEEGRRNLGTSHEKSPSSGNDGREKRENAAAVGREGRRRRFPSRHENAEFATGLLIGAADTDEALQRRKQRYRQELEEQIAEQQRNKKREKDLELRVAATGANDPEKQPDRIGQFGPSRRKGPLFLEPLAAGASRAVRRDIPPPEQPHHAFQSPLLDYSSALGLSLPAPPAAPSFPGAVDVPRNLAYLPHPPSSLGEPSRTPYGEPHQFYGTRNLLDPNMADYGRFPAPGAGFPMSYWTGPPGGAVSSQLGDRSPHSLHSGCSFPEPSVYSSRPGNEATSLDSHASGFPSERSRSARDRILTYRDALNQQEASRRGRSDPFGQIQDQKERRRAEQEEKERYEARLEAEMKNHQPWGRGGGGAPLRDSTGNLIADLNQMHKLNEEAYSNPEQWQRRTTAARRAEPPDTERASGTDRSNHGNSDRLPGFTHVHTPQFARGNVFSNQPSEQHQQEQDKYKAYLQQQIEEKMRKKAEERERTRLEEEKEEKRLAEQRARIQREYEEEQERKKRKELEQKTKNEELIQLAEQRRKEAERRKKEVEEKESAALRRQYERERQARVEEVCREPSPPIPTLQKKHGQRQQHPPRPPSGDSQHSAALLSERSLSGLQSPPVPARRNQLRAAGDRHDLFNELSALRQQLRSEQKRLESRLQEEDWEDLDSPPGFRHRERPAVDVFDMARLRLQAPVRRPGSRNTEPRNLQRIHDSLQLRYSDGESRLQEAGVTSRRSRDYRDSYQQLSSRRSTVQDDYFDLSPTQQSDYQRESERGFLLESESAFIDPLGDVSPEPRAPELERISQLSARERRRLTKQSQRPQERAASSQPLGRHHQEAEPAAEWRTRNRMGRPMAVRRRGNTAGTLDVSDDDSSPRRLNHQSSIETVATDPWTRPGTSDTLKCLDRPLRRERPTTWEKSVLS